MMDKKERNFTICISITILIVIVMIMSAAAADHRSNLDHKSADNHYVQGSDEYSNDEYASDGNPDNNQGINDGQDLTTE